MEIVFSKILKWGSVRRKEEQQTCDLTNWQIFVLCNGRSIAHPKTEIL